MCEGFLRFQKPRMARMSENVRALDSLLHTPLHERLEVDYTSKKVANELVIEVDEKTIREY